MSISFIHTLTAEHEAGDVNVNIAKSTSEGLLSMNIIIASDAIDYMLLSWMFLLP